MTSQRDEGAPRGLAPAAIAIARRRLDGWEPHPAGLLDWLRPQLAPETLHRIAGGSFGLDLEQHLAALVDIQTTGLIPQPLAWHPRETLELERWSNDDHTDHDRFDVKHKLWRRLAARYLDEPAREDPSLAHLADIAERLRKP